MRDPDRIDPTLEALGELWKEHPDLRLGQLVVILASMVMPNGDPFIMEEDKLLKAIEIFKETR